MIDNPFSPHGPASPDVFVNREREVEVIFGHIRAVQRGNVAVSGPLGVGKTSLLRYVADPDVCRRHGVAAPRYAVAYLDVHSVSPFSAVRFWRRAARLLVRLPHVGSAVEGPAAELMEKDTIDVTDVEEFLDAIAERDMVLVLLLDEFEWALQADTPAAESESRNFLAQLASLARRAPRVLSLIVATEPPLVDAVRVIESWRGSPFPTVFTSIALHPLDAEAAEELLDRVAPGPRSKSRSAAIRAVYDATCGQPAALQAAAFALFQGRSDQGRSDQDRTAPWDAASAAAADALETLRTGRAQDAVAPGVEDGVASAPAAVNGASEETDGADVPVSRARLDTLTALEYNLLRALCSPPGRLCSKEDIIRAVWGDAVCAEVDESRVEKLISRLRRKIEPVPARPRHIRTVRGRGYRFVP